MRETFDDHVSYIENPSGDGVGIAQGAARYALRLDLRRCGWYAQEENFGTTEEKRFLVYFSSIVDRLRESYDLVYLVRNERQVKIYDFDTGARFEPDFLLLLQKAGGGSAVQYQVFVEPKGEGFVAMDKRKGDFLLRPGSEGKTVDVLADDREYRGWGLPFFTHSPEDALRRFTDAVDDLVTLS